MKISETMERTKDETVQKNIHLAKSNKPSETTLNKIKTYKKIVKKYFN